MNITIIGNTGAGKTTFAKQLIKKYNTETNIVFGDKYSMVRDSYSGKYMKEFYKNPYQYSYPNEMEFLTNTIKNIAFVNHGRPSEHVIFDRSFLDVYVFIQAMNKIGMLTDDETCKDYTILKRYVDLTLELFLEEIDLIVFMYTDFELLSKNVAKRARNAEVKTLYTEDFTRLALEINYQMNDFVSDLKWKHKIKVLQFNNLSNNSIDSDEYQKALDLVNAIADKM